MLNKKVLIGVGAFGGFVVLNHMRIELLQTKKSEAIEYMNNVTDKELSGLFKNLDSTGDTEYYELKRIIANNIEELKDCITESYTLKEVERNIQKFENYIGYVKTSYSHMM